MTRPPADGFDSIAAPAVLVRKSTAWAFGAAGAAATAVGVATAPAAAGVADGALAIGITETRVGVE